MLARFSPTQPPRPLLLLIAFVIWLRTHAAHADQIATVLDGLTQPCPTEGIPVCGLRDQEYSLFPNSCLLDEFNSGTPSGRPNFERVPLAKCVKGCQIICPKIYKPVCALDPRTQQKRLFSNTCEMVLSSCRLNIEWTKLKIEECNTKMGEKVKTSALNKRLKERERKRQPVPCTRTFNPVCATFRGVKSTFKNECLVNAENIKQGTDWKVVNLDVCAEDFSNSRENPAATKPHTMKQRSFNSNYIYLKPSGEEGDDGMMVIMPPAHQMEYLVREIPRYEEIIKEIVDMSSPQNTFNEYERKFNEARRLTPRLKNEALAKPARELPYPEELKKDFFHNFENERYALRLAKYSHPTTQSSVSAATTIRPTTTSTTTTTARTTTSTITPTTTTPPSNSRSSLRGERQIWQSKIGKFGSTRICAVLPDGRTYQTFDNTYELMHRNIYRNENWTKLHYGECEHCQHDCLKHYDPICISRNGINYTMVNECFYNKGICLDKFSKWKILYKGECRRFIRTQGKSQGSPTTTPSVEPATTSTEKVWRFIKGKLRARNGIGNVRHSNPTRQMSNFKRRRQLNTSTQQPHIHDLASTTIFVANSLEESSSRSPYPQVYIMSLLNRKAKVSHSRRTASGKTIGKSKESIGAQTTGFPN